MLHVNVKFEIVVWLCFSVGGKLWWADDVLTQLGTVNKRDGKNLTVLRNKTTGLVHIKVYDKDTQKGTKGNTSLNVLSQNKARLNNFTRVIKVKAKIFLKSKNIYVCLITNSNKKQPYQWFPEFLNMEFCHFSDLLNAFLIMIIHGWIAIFFYTQNVKTK